MDYKNKLKNQIKQAKKWWENNSTKIYDKSIEFPVEEVLTYNNSVEYKEGLLYHQDLIEVVNHEPRDLYKEIITQVYKYNIEKADSIVEVKLAKYELELIKQRYILDLSINDMAKKNKLTTNYLYSIFSKIKKKIKEEYEKMIKYSNRSV